MGPNPVGVCPSRKRRCRHRPMQKVDHVRTWGEDGVWKSRTEAGEQPAPATLDLGPLASRRGREEISYCLNLPSAVICYGNPRKLL